MKIKTGLRDGATERDAKWVTVQSDVELLLPNVTVLLNPSPAPGEMNFTVQAPGLALSRRLNLSLMRFADQGVVEVAGSTKLAGELLKELIDHTYAAAPAFRVTDAPYLAIVIGEYVTAGRQLCNPVEIEPAPGGTTIPDPDWAANSKD